MNRVKRFIVVSLERWCTRFHFITHHRPWLWLPIPNGHCFLSMWSFALAKRWGIPPDPPRTYTLAEAADLLGVELDDQ